MFTRKDLACFCFICDELEEVFSINNFNEDIVRN